MKARVKDLPYWLIGTLEARGWKLNDELTPREVAQEYVGWHLGDADWANRILDVHAAAVAVQRARCGGINCPGCHDCTAAGNEA